VGATGVTAGAERLGSTTYPIPAGARFVSPSGSDAAAGLLATPWRTLTHAVLAAPSGTTIVLRAGTYREMVETRVDKRFTFQPYPNEEVWLSGSRPVTGWASDGNAWRKDDWTVRFSRAGVDPSMIDPLVPFAGYPDMAFIDGTPLRQVGRRASVVAGTFFVDEVDSKLWVGSDPTGHVVEASVIAEGLHVKAPDTVVRGLGFKHFANPMGRLGAVKAGGARTVIEQNVIVDNATAGLSVIGPDVVVRRNTVTRNGQLGVHGNHATGMQLESNVISGNNAERFITWSAAGGVKVTESTGVLMRGNVADDNWGHGLWYDSSSHDATVVHNVTRRNAAAGIFFEMSNRALIAGNVSTNNEAGIQAGESGDVDLWNNVMIDNDYGFKAYKGYRVVAPTRFTIRNNVISVRQATGLPLLDNDDVTGTLTWSQMGWTSDHNAFYRRSSVAIEFFELLANGPGRLHYKDRQSIAAATGLESNSLSTDNVAVNPYVADAATCNYGLPAGSPALGRGLPLPPNVAAALGRPVGESVNIGIV
jgi:nitrous oxidase accessory protein NosD